MCAERIGYCENLLNDGTLSMRAGRIGYSGGSIDDKTLPMCARKDISLAFHWYYEQQVKTWVGQMGTNGLRYRRRRYASF
ncbi:hypothetical protein DPMN_103371 [Dreissena polymorpha]|uniref:Uncharacterized protein n=1 Tax=Dreissena polymorpha TaxID=45954 RepID=A0A9D4K2M1_DREPO|nr:hypothetical protein DPMN_103371 [Dreissena polymorpha]